MEEYLEEELVHVLLHLRAVLVASEDLLDGVHLYLLRRLEPSAAFERFFHLLLLLVFGDCFGEAVFGDLVALEGFEFDDLERRRVERCVDDLVDLRLSD